MKSKLKHPIAKPISVSNAGATHHGRYWTDRVMITSTASARGAARRLTPKVLARLILAELFGNTMADATETFSQASEIFMARTIQEFSRERRYDNAQRAPGSWLCRKFFRFARSRQCHRTGVWDGAWACQACASASLPPFRGSPREVVSGALAIRGASWRAHSDRRGSEASDAV
jgi:hypothetical protein